MHFKIWWRKKRKAVALSIVLDSSQNVEIPEPILIQYELWMKGCILKRIHLLEVWEVKQENRRLKNAARQAHLEHLEMFIFLWSKTIKDLFTKIDAFIVIWHLDPRTRWTRNGVATPLDTRTRVREMTESWLGPVTHTSPLVTPHSTPWHATTLDSEE